MDKSQSERERRRRRRKKNQNGALFWVAPEFESQEEAMQPNGCCGFSASRGDDNFKITGANKTFSVSGHGGKEKVPKRRWMLLFN